jgi:hypothetical protein
VLLAACSDDGTPPGTDDPADTGVDTGGDATVPHDTTPEPDTTAEPDTTPGPDDTTPEPDTEEHDTTPEPDTEEHDTTPEPDADEPDADPHGPEDCEALLAEAPCAQGQRCVEGEDGPACRAWRVLTLEESDDTGVIADALEAWGVEVVRGPAFPAWQGEHLDTVNAVVWFEGVYYRAEMPLLVQSMLVSFVNRGGGLVRTEWSAYSGYTGPADGLTPVVAPESDYEEDEVTFRRLLADHPIGATLPASFTADPVGWSYVDALPGATVVWDNGEGVPMVTTITFGGRVVHVNHDVTYSEEPLDPEVVTLFRDAALWSLGEVTPPEPMLE